MIRLAIRCSPDQAERVLAELVELVPGGVEEDRGGDYVEYAIYGPPGELPELPDLEVAAGEGLVEIETTEIPDDWADRWRDFHEPVWIGERLVVRPSWGAAGSSEALDAAPIEIVIDPGRAFGTGAHATTSMCLELLLERTDSEGASATVADLGTGSGVLAIAAAKLGYERVVAVDHEQPAVGAARANARLNGAEVEVERLNLRERPAPAADLWLLNLTAPLLLPIAERLAEGDADARPRELICSGLLGSERERVGSAFARAGYTAAASRERGEWAAFHLVAS